MTKALADAYLKHRQKIHYVIVGGWNTLFGYMAYVLLYHWLGQQVHYVVLVVPSKILAITNAFICYKWFVFKTKGNVWREYFRTYVVYGAAFLINLCMLPLLVELGHVSPPHAQAMIIFATAIISYFGHRSYSFLAPKSGEAPAGPRPG